MIDREEVHRVFISYSHDSAEHKARVRALADRLRLEGVDCWIDEYVPHPPQGWPTWMRLQIREADFVLVVCSELYLRRVDLLELPGRGLGATWEGGLITVEVYEAQGRNEKFIPILFSSSDVEYVPDFLRGVTRYDVSSDNGYDALYARLTKQQIVQVPPLGQKRIVGRQHPSSTPAPAPTKKGELDVTEVDFGSLVLLHHNGSTSFLDAPTIEERDGRINLQIRSRGARDSAFLARLKDRWGRVDVALAYRNVAHLARVEDVSVVHSNGEERWQLALTPSESDYGATSEMGTSDHSPDQIAELRARRILLNERPPEEIARWVRPDPILESLIQGVSTPLSIERSPFPGLFSEGTRDPKLFLAMARLLAVFQLRLSGTVEHILELDLSFEGDRALSVYFVGRRRDIYTNRPAAEITFEGVCAL